MNRRNRPCIWLNLIAGELSPGLRGFPISIELGSLVILGKSTPILQGKGVGYIRQNCSNFYFCPRKLRYIPTNIKTPVTMKLNF